MNGKEWYDVIEDFFYDGHKMAYEEYSIELDGEHYYYVVPDVDDEEWIRFTYRMEMDAGVLTAYQVYEIAAECGIDIPLEILEFLEQS